jgi:MbtH protein
VAERDAEDAQYVRRWSRRQAGDVTTRSHAREALTVQKAVGIVALLPNQIVLRSVGGSLPHSLSPDTTFLAGADVMTDDEVDDRIYKVVLNHEEQYSIWPADRENPLGWRDDGKVGPKAECLAYINEVWTDMRPLSLRKKMEEAGSVAG